MCKRQHRDIPLLIRRVCAELGATCEFGMGGKHHWYRVTVGIRTRKTALSFKGDLSEQKRIEKEVRRTIKELNE